METYKIETTIKENHKIEIDNLPFPEGESVEVTISKKITSNGKDYLMIGEPVTYIDPFEPVSEDDWDVLK